MLSSIGVAFMKVYCSVVLLFAAAVVDAQQVSPPATDIQSPFLSVAPAISDEFRFASQFPEFEAKDISGRTWRFEDLRGKFTLIYIWNTFEARLADQFDPHARYSDAGLPDLPHLQRFYEKSRTAKNIQVLTFCVDYDYMHAHDYMKQEKYTFPVIADWVLTNKLFPADTCKHGCSYGVSTPTGSRPLASRQWAVNPEGRLSYPFYAWSFGRLLFELEAHATN
jgi:hypothetical protein